jgi:4-hydroxy-3-polyprenylbenzoate decarboxylase
MSLTCLDEFLVQLESVGDLLRIETEVDPVLEIAEITRRVCRGGGAAIRFERVRGHETPVVTNLLGTPERLAAALEIGSLDELSTRLNDDIPREGNWLQRITSWPERGEKYHPKTTKTARAQQIVHLGSDVDLGQLPCLQDWPQEASRNVTGLVVAQSRQTDQRTAATHRLSVVDSRRLSFCVAPHDPLWQIFDEYREAREKMSVAVSVGGPPVLALVGACRLTRDVDPWSLAGALQRAPMDLVTGRTHDVLVPATAELVIEGHIDPSEENSSSPAQATSSGYCAPSRPSLTIQVGAVTHRTNYVLPAQVIGPSPSDQSVLTAAVERIYWPLVQSVAAEIVDYALPSSGDGQVVFAAIRKTYPQQARKVAQALWGLDVLARTKMIVVVDATVDVHDDAAVWRQTAVNVDPSHDVIIGKGPGNFLDHAAVEPLCGGKLLLDATAKMPGEQRPHWPELLEIDSTVRDLVDRRWSEYGLDDGP